MKKSLLLALIFATFGATAQQKLIGTNATEFDETGAVVYIDSSELIYNTWDGSLFSNEPQFIFEGSVIDWTYELPAIKWNMQNIYDGPVMPLSLSETFNNTLVNGNATVSESASEKDEFIYDATGNLINQKSYYFNGTIFVLNVEQTYEFDANNNKTVQQYIYHGSGSPIVETIDSMSYDASNNLTRSISNQWDGTSAFYTSSESIITYTGSEVLNVALYQGDQSTPLEWMFDIDYVYASGQPTNILGYQVVGGVPDTVVFVEIDLSYGANNKLALYQVSIDGDLFEEIAYGYDPQDFLTDMTSSEIDFNTSMVYVFEEVKFYYQSTAGIDAIVIAEATIAPSPSSDFISISTDSDIEQVAIFALNGSIMLTQTSGDVDISNLPAGVYIAKVKTSSGVSQARFVKQ